MARPERSTRIARSRRCDESLADSASLLVPYILAQEIADDLRSALAQIEDILGDLEQRVPGLAKV